MRIPITTRLHIEGFNSGAVTVKESGTINAVYGQRADGTVYATQRPGINIFEDASETVSDVKGRGCYYWDSVGAKYFVNDDTVYKGSYAAPLAANLSSGIERVEFFEVGDYLVILDSENNEGWYISSAADTTLVQITDVDFPTEQATPLQLAKGGAVLGGILYVGTTNGELWNSGTENPTTWGSADFIEAEVSPDDLVAIYNHSEHIVGIGTRSTEFFYNNANPAGSPLNVRSDVHHELGMADFNSAWVQMNSLYFVGQTAAGSLGVYVIDNFQVSKLSDNEMDSLLTSALIADGGKCVGSGFTSGGRTFYCLTVYFESGGLAAPVATYVHDSEGAWSEFELMHSSIDDFPLVDWTKASTTRAGEGILSNGDLVTVVDTLSPIDTVQASAYIASGYIDSGYYVGTSDSGTNISMEIVTGASDSNTLEPKFCDRMRAICRETTASQTLTVQWSDGDNESYNTGRTIDLSSNKNKLNRLGSYKTRNYKLTYAGSEQIEIEGLEASVR